MRILKIILGLIVALFLIGLITTFVIGNGVPDEMTVTQTMKMNAPASAAYNQVNELKNWENWSPWYKMEPDMDLTYSGNTSGANSWYKWKGDKTGEGQLTIKNTVPNKRIDTYLEFKGMGDSNGFWEFKPNGNATDVTWGMTAKTGDNFFAKAMTKMFFPRAMKKSFNEGLTNMKGIVEGS